MEKKLNLVQVFLATKAFLSKIYFNKYSDDLGSFLGEFSINKCKKDWQQDPETWDPSVWNDWMQSVHVVLNMENVNVQFTIVSSLEAYFIMKNFVQKYAIKLSSDDLIQLSNNLTLKDNQSFFWKDWLQCIDATITDRLTVDGSLVSLDTIVSEEQAFEIMKIFLKNYLISKNVFSDSVNMYAILNQNKNIYIDWLIEYSKYKDQHSNNKNLTVIQAFNVMYKFLKKQKEQMKIINEKYVNLLQMLKVNTEQNPVNYMILYYWLQAAYVSILK